MRLPSSTFALLVLLVGCSHHDEAAPATGGDDVGIDTAPADDTTVPADDTTDATPAPEDVCAVL